MDKQISRIKFKDKEFIVDTKVIDNIGKKITRNSNAICILDYECFQDHGNTRFNLNMIWNIPFLFCASIIKYDGEKFVEVNKESFDFSKQNMNTEHLKKNLRILFLKLKNFIESNKVKLIVVMGGRTERDFDSFCKKEFNLSLDCEYFDLWEDFFLRRDLIQPMSLDKNNRIQTFLELFDKDLSTENMSSKQIGKEATKFFNSYKRLKLNTSDIRKHCFIDLDRGRIFLNILMQIYKKSNNIQTQTLSANNFNELNNISWDIKYDDKRVNKISALELDKHSIIYNRNEIDTFLYPLKRKGFHLLQLKEKIIKEKIVEKDGKKISVPINTFCKMSFSKIEYIDNQFKIINSEEFEVNDKNNVDEVKYHQDIRKYFEQYCSKNDVSIIIHEASREMKRLILKLKNRICEKFDYDITTKSMVSLINNSKNTNIRFTSLNKPEDIFKKLYESNNKNNMSFAEYTIYILNYVNKLCFSSKQINLDKKN